MRLVKFITDDDGGEHHSRDWHYVQTWGDADRSLCNGEVFGFGESALKYREKNVERGGITCRKCLEIIHEIKSIKL